MDLKAIQHEWQRELSSLYDEREVRNILLLVLEDLFGFIRTDLLTQQVKLDGDRQEELKLILSKLKLGEPVQQVIGFTFFDGLKIYVSTDVLTPRPETEELVFWIHESISTETPLIVDLCTGSGCIALALKNRFPSGKVKGVDVSEVALAVAQKNANELNLSVEWIQSDLLKEVLHLQEVDVLVSNPPYIPWSEKRKMHQNVTSYEPDLALFVPNDDPLLFYRTIGDIAMKSLKAGGLLFFELHENFAVETQQLMLELGFEYVELKLDLQGKKRMLKAQKSI